MRDYKTIKTKPREVRGRVMHVAGKASSGAAYFSADKLRSIRREAQVRKQETTPEGDAVSNVEDQASQTMEKVPYAAYKLTQAHIRLIKKVVAKRRERALAMVEEPAPQETTPESVEPPTVETPAPTPSDPTQKSAPQTDTQKTVQPDAAPKSEQPATEKPKKKSSRRKKASSKGEAKSPDEPVPLSEDGLQDQINRPLSEREISKARDNRRRKNQSEIRKDAPTERKTPAAAKKEAPIPVQEKAPVSSDGEVPGSTFRPRIRTKATDIQHERPPAQLPRTREIARQPVESAERVFQRQRPPIRTADNAVKTAAHQSAAQTAKIKTRAADKAKQATAQNAEKAAKHMADIARRHARKMAENLKRA